MDWALFGILAAQITLGSVLFMILSFPLAFGLRNIVRAFWRPWPQEEDPVIYRGDNHDGE